jgi:hypothetical protein
MRVSRRGAFDEIGAAVSVVSAVTGVAGYRGSEGGAPGSLAKQMNLPAGDPCSFYISPKKGNVVARRRVQRLFVLPNPSSIRQ